MPTPLTPWAGLVTPDPVGFIFGRRDHRLYVSIGQNGAVCSADLRTGAISRQAAPGAKPTTVDAYRLSLRRWNNSESPIVQAHPFLLPHLAVSRQVDLDELMSRFGGREHVLRSTGAIQQPCDLLSMMGLERMGLTLSTIYNLNIGRK